MLRPGATKTQGWLWVLGVKAEGPPKGKDCATFLEALDAWGNPEGLESLRALLVHFQTRLTPKVVHTRRVDASYWSSANVVASYPSVPGCLVLLGDAACGKPFYTGTTLNGHLQDVVPLVYETNWLEAPLTPPRFAPYSRRCADRVRHPEFQEQKADVATAAPAAQQPADIMQRAAQLAEKLDAQLA